MTQTEAASATTLRITRKLAAPRELVFKAWTEPEFLFKWWAAGPDFTTPIAEVDLRVGGKYRLGMQPPGKDQPSVIGGVYREVTPPEKLVYTWVWEHEEDFPESIVTVEFREKDGGTEISLVHALLPSAQSRDQHGEGWQACTDRLSNTL